MWKRVALTALIDHPPARVFPYLADPARWPEFAPAVEYRRPAGDGPPAVGSRWAAVDRILGPFRVQFEDILEEVEPDRRVVWHSTAPWNSRVEYACMAEGTGTRIHACYEGDIAGWLGVSALLPGFAWRWILMRDFRGLDRVLAAPPAGRSCRCRSAVRGGAMSTAADPREAYASLIAAVEANDPETVKACLSPSIVDHSAPPDQPPGSAGIVTWMQGMHESLSGLKGVVEDTVVEGDKVAGRVTWSGTHTGSFAGLPATGRPVTFAAMHVLRFEDGLATEWWGVPDLYGALVRLGATLQLPPA